MEPFSKAPNLAQKRRSDFYTGIVILIMSIAMLIESLSFPMQESYAGVENVWYVSPALLPILVSALLIILSLALIRKAIYDGGMAKALTDLPTIGKAILNEQFLLFLMIVLYLSIYVYALIPSGDFYLTSMVFLFAFVLPFYLDNSRLLSVTFWPFSVIGLFIGLSGHTSTLNTPSIDYILLALMIFIVCFSRFKIGNDASQKSKWLITLLSSVITPLILIPAFKFGLLVPLPTEGIVIHFLERIAL